MVPIRLNPACGSARAQQGCSEAGLRQIDRPSPTSGGLVACLVCGPSKQRQELAFLDFQPYAFGPRSYNVTGLPTARTRMLNSSTMTLKPIAK